MIQEINRCLMEASNRYDVNAMKIDAILEATHREYEINCTASELKVMQENGTSDDLNYLLEEAGNGMVEKVLAALKKIREAIMKFFRDIKDKIISIFSKPENEEKVEQIEKKIKFFPFIGKKKIKINDHEAMVKNAQEHESKLSKLLAKIKGKQTVDPDEIDEIEESFLVKHHKIIATASVIVTVAGGIAIYQKFFGKGKKSIDTVENMKAKTDANIDDATATAYKAANDTGDPRVVNAVTNIAKAIANVNKQAATATVSFGSSLLSKIKEAVTGIGGTLKKMKNTKIDVKESALYENPYYGYDLFGEDSDDAGTDFGSAGPDEKPDTDSTENSGNVSEYGEDDDPIDSVNPELDDDNTDPWDDVMRDNPDDLNDAFESAYSDLYDDIISDPCDCGYDDKPSNDKIVASLYDQINNIKGLNRNSVNESAFDSLMNDIDNLEFL